MTTAASEAPAAARDDRSERVLDFLLWGAVAIAVFVRVAWLWSKPFWRDEAWVALLVADPMSAATDARAVPLGFVWLVKLTSWIPFVLPEVSYRIVPLLAGIAAVALIARLATALGASKRTGVMAAWIAAGMHPLVYYSRELKPYDLDLLLAIVLPLAALRGFTGSAPSAGWRAAFAAGVVVGPWVSFAGLFAIGAVLSWGWLAWLKDFAGTLRRDWLLASAGFLVSFAIVYFVALGAQSTSDVQHSFWGQYLLIDGPAPFLEQAVEAAKRLVSISISYPLGDMKKVALPFLVIGAWTWPAAGRTYLLWLTAGMAGLCFAAVSIDRYLIAQGRHLLFLVPILILCIANGLDAIGTRMGRRAGLAVLLVPILVTLWWTHEQVESRTHAFASSWTRFFRFDVLHDMDTALEKSVRDIGPRDPVLITNKNSYAFQFYRRGRLPQARYCPRYCFDFKDQLVEWLDNVEKRGWIILTDEEIPQMDKQLDRSGFVHRQRNVASGIRLWQIDRVGPGWQHRRK